MKRLFTLSLLLFAAITLQAKTFEGTVEEYLNDSYKTKALTFKLSEIATELGTDATTLATALDAWMAVGISDELPAGTIDMLSLASDEHSVAYSTNYRGGFYMTGDGKAATWSSGGVWYEDVSWSTTDDAFTFSIGQRPDSCEVGDTFTASFALTYDGTNEVLFNVSLKIIEKPTTVNDPVYSHLNILKTYEVSTTQHVRTNYNTDAMTVNISDVFGQLGLDGEVAANALEDYLYATTQSESGARLDSLTNEATSSGIGWWLKQLYNEDTDKDLPECASYAYGETCTFYVDGFEYDNTTGDLSFGVGQYPSTLTPGAQYYTYIYLIKGTNAIEIKVVLNIDDVVVSLNTMERVGGETISIQYDVNAVASMDKQTIDINLENIVPLFGDGVTVDDLNYGCLDNLEEKTLTYDLTSSDGFYMTWEGLATAYGDSEMKCKIGYKPANNILNFAYTDDTVDPGTKCTASVFLTYQDMKYYEFKMDIEFVGETEEDTTQTEKKTIEDCEVVAKEELNIELVYTGHHNTQYYDSENSIKTNIVTDLGADHVQGLIGTAVPVLYAYGYDSENDSVYFTNSYTGFSACMLGVTEGFWIAADNNGNYVGEYSNSAVGIVYADYQIEWWEIAANTAVGSTYDVLFSLANLTNGKRIDYTAHVKLIDPSEYKTWNDVGSAQFVVSNDGEVNEYDLTAVYEALGCTAEEFAAAGEVAAQISENGYTTNGFDDMYGGYAFNEEGLWVSQEDETTMDQIRFFLGYKFEDGGFVCETIDSQYDNETYKANLAFTYGDNRYIIVINVTNDPAGIKDVNADVDADGKVVYNLAGQAVDGTYRGIVIKNGKKFFVNK